MAAPSSVSPAWPSPESGASLLLAFTAPRPVQQEASTSTPTLAARRTILIMGSGRLASIRAFSCLEAGHAVAVLPCSGDGKIHDPELAYRISSGQIALLDVPAACDEELDAHAWLDSIRASIPADVLDDILLVCITDTIATTTGVHPPPRSPASALAIRQAFFKLRIPVNVADYPSLSDFHFPATHRFPLIHNDFTTADEDGKTRTSSASPLQIAITTNGNSCRLASRIRREIVSKLPKGIGSAVARIGKLRQQARTIDHEEQRQQPNSEEITGNDSISPSWSLDGDIEQGEREEGWSSSLLNKPVPQILASRPSIQAVQSLSKCTSPNRHKQKIQAGIDEMTLRPLHPSQMPLTPPATPPLRALANPDHMDSILSAGSGARQIVPPSLTRMRFIAQISEYWPIEKLANMTAEEGQRVISLYADSKLGSTQRASTDSDMLESGPSGPLGSSSETRGVSSSNVGNNNLPSSVSSSSVPKDTELPPHFAPRHQLALDSLSQATPQPKGKIFLLGSGPGSPALLTMAAHTLLTKHATLILSDKLVPSEILALIPPSIPLTIAKKFPGNAEGAQNELMDLAYQGAMKGEIVVRLKQGDPYVYGRGGEEVLFFRERGFESIVVPGISSAFAAPLMAGIPVTQRGVSESVTVTTGVGRKGKGVKLPGYERSRTLTVLMGVARLAGVVNALISVDGTEGNGREGGGRQGAAYPPYCPIAIIEKGSSPDQRLVASTLEGIVSAMERVGEQRPPGMMIIGWSVLALEGKGDVEVLDGVEGLSEQELESLDRKRVDKWLNGQTSIVREGLDSSWSDLVSLQGDGHPSS